MTLIRTGPGVAGVDEAGRGPLLGDVYAACVVLPAEFDDEREDKPMHAWIRDSKKLAPKRRRAVADYIRRNAVAWGVGSASVEEIQRLNIAHATFLAMARAVRAAQAGDSDIQQLLVDGPRFKPPRSNDQDEDPLPSAVRCICDGDATHMAIAAASILAKVAHDDHILALVKADPSLDERYGLAHNMGYGTRVHMEGLQRHGYVPGLHREGFTPVTRARPASRSGSRESSRPTTPPDRAPDCT